jgi:hypothetical protein
MARDETSGGVIAAQRSGENAPRRLQVVALALAASVLAGPALAQNPYCDDLRARIANAGGGGPGAARYRAAAAKQQQEIDRTVAYGRSIGCDRQQFLFFGEPPPPQCGVISRRIAQMRANLAGLMRAGGEGDRQALMARYDQQCRMRAAARPRNFLDDLFGGGAQEEDPQPMRESPRGLEEEDSEMRGHGLGGSMAICVRACDGGFFPISYSARRANLETLAELCKAQCPNAEVELYTRSPWRELDTALSIEGRPYSEHPNALKFTKSYDASCGCKPPGRSWAESLADAERLLAEKHQADEVVSAEKAEQLSRPAVANVRKPGPTIEAAPSFVDRAASHGRETWREVVGPGGVKKRVRVIAPTL